MTAGVKFWGVRGSIACPSSSHVVYGGNTSCVELSFDDICLILDAGTGIRPLGHDLLGRGGKKGTILLTHTHWDHINGFPFFAPAYKTDGEMHIMAGHLAGQGGIRKVFSSQMSNPLFPVPLDALKAEIIFTDFERGESFSLFSGKVQVYSTTLNHPNGATGYRVEWQDKVICYVTDTEHVPGKPDENILSLIEGADLVIYDSTYTDSRVSACIGWGHSAWREGLSLAGVANVKRLALFDHDPDHDDEFMLRLEEDARRQWRETIVARDGMTLTV